MNPREAALERLIEAARDLLADLPISREWAHRPKADALSAALDALPAADGGWRAIDDETLRTIVRADKVDRIQGFLYGDRRVIRDVFKPFGQQVVWQSTVDACSEDEFLERCAMERLRVALSAALPPPPVPQSAEDEG